MPLVNYYPMTARAGGLQGGCVVDDELVLAAGAAGNKTSAPAAMNANKVNLTEAFMWAMNEGLEQWNRDLGPNDGENDLPYRVICYIINARMTLAIGTDPNGVMGGHSEAIRGF